MIAKIFPPARPFSQEMVDLPAGNMKPHKFLEGLEVTLPQHSSHRIIQTLAHDCTQIQRIWNPHSKVLH